MIVPQFLRFYGGYDARSALNEYAITFFSLVNSMFRLQAQEMQSAITAASMPYADSAQSQEISDNLGKASRGLHGILQEVRVVRKCQALT